MTALATIADQSDADLWPTWVLVAAVAAVVLFGLASLVRLVLNPGTAPVMGDEPSRLDLADRPRCRMAHCGYPGTVERITTADIGVETVHVCPGHSDEGDVKGWWVA